jgi:diguanylate cyclase (GGDEF)-like protein
MVARRGGGEIGSSVALAISTSNIHGERIAASRTTVAKGIRHAAPDRLGAKGGLARKRTGCFQGFRAEAQSSQPERLTKIAAETRVVWRETLVGGGFHLRKKPRYLRGGACPTALPRAESYKSNHHGETGTMIAMNSADTLKKHGWIMWLAVGASAALICMGQFGFVDGWRAILFLNTGGIGLISCLGLSELGRRHDEREIRRLREVATMDPLTGTGNRRWFDQELGRRVTQFRRYRTPCSLLVIDADHFKSINDTWGHDVGDQVLISLVRVITATLRDIDLLFRIGGEEFAALLPETEGVNAAIAAERVRVAISELQIPVGSRRIQINASVGGSQLLSNDSGESWFKRADNALLEAKQQGRDRVVFYATVNEVAAPTQRNQVDQHEASPPKL